MAKEIIKKVDRIGEPVRKITEKRIKGVRNLSPLLTSRKYLCHFSEVRAVSCSVDIYETMSQNGIFHEWKKMR